MRCERRVRALASRAGRCHVHMTRLFCLECAARRSDPTWTGTDTELHELLDLFDRVDTYTDQIPAAGVCPEVGCGGKRYCERCYNAAALVLIPDDLYNAEELARRAELLRHLQPLPRLGLIGN